MKLSISEIAKATGGRILGDAPLSTITAVSTDTREIKPGALFVPIAGNNVDGHDFIQAAAKKGAICAFTEKCCLAEDVNIPLIYVSSTRRALMDLAGYYRRKHDVLVVAITGSAGKTTTKDMIANILSKKFKTKKTMGNFNNDIGLPLSIFQLTPEDEVLVLEMGMNHAGEIHALSLTGAPDVVLITHIGDAHIENFENREGILHAKLEIVDGLKPGGTVILNGDDPLLTGYAATEKTKHFDVLYPCAKNILKQEPIGLEKTKCNFSWNGQKVNLTVPIPGAHMVMNALLATVVGLEMGVNPAQIAKGFDELVPAGGRLTVETANDMTIINDAYNANPDAMKAAIEILCKQSSQNSRKVAVLGDMNELGHVAEPRHTEVGEYAAESGIDLLIAIGPMSKKIYDGFCATSESNNAHYFNNSAEFLENWKNHLKPGDTVLVKASRSMAFDNIINALIKEQFQ